MSDLLAPRHLFSNALEFHTSYIKGRGKRIRLYPTIGQGFSHPSRRLWILSVPHLSLSLVSLIEHMATTHRSLQVVICKLNRTLFPVLLTLASSWAIKTDEQICVRVLGCLAPGESSTTSDEGLTDSRVKLNSHHAETRRDETRQDAHRPSLSRAS